MKLENNMLCPICEKGYLKFTISDIEVHVFEEILKIPSIEQYICDVCGDGFASEDSREVIEKIFKIFRKYKEK